MMFYPIRQSLDMILEILVLLAIVRPLSRRPPIPPFELVALSFAPGSKIVPAFMSFGIT